MKSKFSGHQIDFSHNVKLKSKEQIGSGSFSYIYATNDPKYVLKLINQNDEKYVKSFQNEKYAYETIGKHDNITECIGSKENINLKGVLHSCLALENCPKGSVINMIVNKKIIFSEAQILQILYDIVAGLQRLHSLSTPIAHRDLKLENILLGENGKFKLCDFGSISTKHVKQVNSSNRYELTEDIESNTTPPYRAPEQCDLYSSYPINEMVDIWALGCLLFVLAYQKLPFESKLSQINCQYYLPKTPAYTDGITDIFQMMFVIDPQKRCTTHDLLIYLQTHKTSSPLISMKSLSNIEFNKGDNQNQDKQHEASSSRKNSINSQQHFDFNGFGKANEVKPSFLSKCNKYFTRITKKTEAWVLSALEENEDGPNQKYMRFLIIKAWHKKDKIKKFYNAVLKKLAKTNNDNTIVSLKCLIVIHNYFKKGPPEIFDIALNKDTTPIDIISSINKTWKPIVEMNLSNSRDKKRHMYTSRLIYDYSELLIKKIRLHLKYLNSFEGNFSLNPFFINPSEANNPINTNSLKELISYMEYLVRFQDTLLINHTLWKIQISLALSIIDEEYCILSLLIHLINTFKYASNFISIDIDKLALQNTIKDMEDKFEACFHSISAFFVKCSNLIELANLRDLIPILQPEIINYIKSTKILQGFHVKDFNLGHHLNYNINIYDIKIPLSYGIAVKDLNILDIMGKALINF